MAKQTKRSRKFERKGGVKGLLSKKGSTITNKGKLKRSKSKRKDGTKPAEVNELASQRQLQQEEQAKRQESNFLNPTKTLGDLDMDGFFASFESGQVESDSTNDSTADSSDNDNDDDEDDEEERVVKNEDVKEDDDASNDGSTGSDSSSKSDSSSSSDSEEEADMEKASTNFQKELSNLKESDPDFHQFLQENEKSLLEFQEEDSGEEDEDIQVNDNQEEDVRDDNQVDNADKTQKNKDDKSILLTPALLQRLQEGAFESHGVKSLKRIVSAYKSACHLADASLDSQDKSGKDKVVYRIDSSTVFNDVMVSCLNHVHEEFHHHLLQQQEEDDSQAYNPNQPISPKLLMKSEKYSQLKPIMESYFKSTLYVLNHQAKDAELLTVILKSISSSFPYLTPFPKLATKLLASLVQLWSSPREDSDDYQVVRVEAFLRIRQLALTQPFPFVEECLKKTYLAYAQCAKFVNSSSSTTNHHANTSATATTTLPTLIFMGNCLVELYCGLDVHSAYQHAFVYIRQLALHLRTAMHQKTPQAFQAIYCWQYIHCLKLWTAILVKNSVGDEEELQEKDHFDKASRQMLQSLVYPLCEVIHGMVNLIPTAKHIPIKFHAIQMLQQLAAASSKFIPTSGFLMETLQYKELFLPTRKDTKRSKGFHLSQLLKLSSTLTLRTTEQQEAVIQQVFQLLEREVDLYRYSPGFPEYAIGICQKLRKFAKETKNSRWRAYAKGCIDTCERYSNAAVKGRSSLQEAPKDVKVLEVLKPTKEPNMYARHEALLAKSRGAAAGAPSLSSKAAAEATSKKRNDVSQQEESQEKERPAKKKKHKKKSLPVNESDLNNVDALQQNDQVQEGIDWSDDEDGSED